MKELLGAIRVFPGFICFIHTVPAGTVTGRDRFRFTPEKNTVADVHPFSAAATQFAVDPAFFVAAKNHFTSPDQR